MSSKRRGSQLFVPLSYLVRRDGKKIINRHISEKELPELQKLIDEREKCRKEIRASKKRMAYDIWPPIISLSITLILPILTLPASDKAY